jgi:hypothetical protein
MKVEYHFAQGATLGEPDSFPLSFARHGLAGSIHTCSIHIYIYIHSYICGYDVGSRVGVKVGRRYGVAESKHTYIQKNTCIYPV